ncbi:hypothetical protein BAY61_32405 (plasmid) [Prauserella marina]|nr:hypothetical protein BAY61_32405 [Prauserella marina]
MVRVVSMEVQRFGNLHSDGFHVAGVAKGPRPPFRWGASLVLLYEVSTPVACLISDIRCGEDPTARIDMLVDRVRRR